MTDSDSSISVARHRAPPSTTICTGDIETSSLQSESLYDITRPKCPIVAKDWLFKVSHHYEVMDDDSKKCD